jgi:beta-N-acetylhexosaminidase
MKALPQDARQAVDVAAALRAGVDLLLVTADRASQARIESAARRAVELHMVDEASLAASLERIRRLREWIASHEAPPLHVVGSSEHRALAAELAARALTLVRDEAGLLPLRLTGEHRVLAIMPAPRDLTPADTSSFVTPTLADALRGHGPQVDEVITEHPPTPAEVAALRSRASGYDTVVVGTISASPGSAQAELVRALLDSGRPVITVALRTPWDLTAYPEAGTHVCTYSILPESMTALADALFGSSGRGAEAFPGRLPVRLDMRVTPAR